MPPDYSDGDIRLWIVAGVSLLGLVLSVWNAIQTRRLRGIEGRVRALTIRLDEFRSQVRDPIRAAMAAIPPLVRKISATAQTRTSIDDHEQELGDLNGEAFDTLGAVSDALAAADRNRFVDGEDWLGGVQPTEDAIADAFNLARDQSAAHSDRLRAVQAAADALASFKDSVDVRLDEALESFAEESGRTAP